MKTGPRIATAVAVGYVLGRTRKMKLALALGGFVMGRRLGGGSSGLGEEAGKLMPDELTQLRGRLMDAAKSAATSAASNKIESWGSDLAERAEKIRPSAERSAAGADSASAEPEPGQPDEGGEEAEKPGRESARPARAAKPRGTRSTGRTAKPGKPARPRTTRGDGDG